MKWVILSVSIEVQVFMTKFHLIAVFSLADTHRLTQYGITSFDPIRVDYCSLLWIH